MIRASVKWLLLITGTIIGAGYASGRELWQFFGHESGLAIIIFMMIFSVACAVIMYISYQKQSESYNPVLIQIMGLKFGKIYDVLIFLYLFTTTIVMIAGSGATAQTFSIPFTIGVVITVLLLIAVFLKGVNGILVLNQLIIPILIIGLLFVLFYFTFDEKINLLYFGSQENWIAAFPFTALNILPIIAVVGAIGNKIKTKGEIWIASIGSGVILGLISYVYNHSLIHVSDDLIYYEIPLFAILNGYSMKFIILMSIILWLAIFTTAVSGMLGLVSRLHRVIQKKPMWMIVSGLLILMFPLSFFGFSTLIKYLYPLYGFLNLYLLVRLLFYPLWHVIDHRK